MIMRLRWLWVQYLKWYRKRIGEKCENCGEQDKPLYSEWQIIMCEKCILAERKGRP